jgi:hypothetical protein
MGDCSGIDNSIFRGLGGAQRIKVTMRFKVCRSERFVEKGEKTTKGFIGFFNPG